MKFKSDRNIHLNTDLFTIFPSFAKSPDFAEHNTLQSWELTSYLISGFDSINPSFDIEIIVSGNL